MATTRAKLADDDAALVDTAEAALDALYEQYFEASAKDQLLLKPQIELAAQGVLKARILLLAPGTIAADADVKEANRIRGEIEQAASTQELILGVVRLISLLAKF
jgi:hypothetical protein